MAKQDTILHKRSGTTGKVPLATDLDRGELGINYEDEKIFFKDSSGNITEFSTGTGGRSVNLTGKTLLNQSENTTYTITDYHSLSTYSVSVSGGSASINNNIITLTAPNSGSNFTLTVNRDGNNNDFEINLNTPIISDPIPPSNAIQDGATNIPEEPVFNGGPFVTNPPGSDTHQSTDWIIKDSNGNIVWQSLNNTSNKTSIQIPSGVLQANSTYTLQYRYTGTNLGDGDWVYITFTTASVFVSSSLQYVNLGLTDDDYHNIVSVFDKNTNKYYHVMSHNADENLFLLIYNIDGSIDRFMKYIYSSGFNGTPNIILTNNKICIYTGVLLMIVDKSNYNISSMEMLHAASTISEDNTYTYNDETDRILIGYTNTTPHIISINPNNLTYEVFQYDIIDPTTDNNTFTGEITVLDDYIIGKTSNDDDLGYVIDKTTLQGINIFRGFNQDVFEKYYIADNLKFDNSTVLLENGKIRISTINFADQNTLRYGYKDYISSEIIGYGVSVYSHEVYAKKIGNYIFISSEFRDTTESSRLYKIDGSTIRKIDIVCNGGTGVVSPHISGISPVDDSHVSISILYEYQTPSPDENYIIDIIIDLDEENYTKTITSSDYSFVVDDITITESSMVYSYDSDSSNGLTNHPDNITTNENPVSSPNIKINEYSFTVTNLTSSISSSTIIDL